MNKIIDLPKKELMKKIEEITFDIDRENVEVSNDLEEILDNIPSFATSSIVKECSEYIKLSESLASTLKLSQVVADSMKFKTSNMSKILMPNVSDIITKFSMPQIPQIRVDFVVPKYDFSEYFGLAFTGLGSVIKAQNDLINSGVYKSIIDSIRSSMGMATNALRTIGQLDLSYDNINRLIYKRAFEEYKKVSYKFYHKGVFPPINYFIDKEIDDISYDFDIEEFILGDEVNEYYLNVVSSWKDKYDDIYVQSLISDIEFNLKHKRSYAIVSMIPMLIEYMLNESFLGEYMLRTGGYRYSAIKLLLEERVFSPLDINYLHRKFINKNLYSSTNKAEEFSRHMTHGDKLEFGNMKTAMNMIFIYDFLQEIIVLEEKEETVA